MGEWERRVEIVVGGQYGSEGKGKVTEWLISEGKFDAAVRGGSENAGHTMTDDNGITHKMQVIPCAWKDPNVELYVAPAAVFSIAQLLIEIHHINTHMGGEVRGRLGIDGRCGIIDVKHISQEENLRLAEAIGSTVHGCGAALIDKIWRRGHMTAKEFPNIMDIICDVDERISEHMDNDHAILLEGTQGTFLSLNHGYYPYVTSRDCLASSIASEAGIGPRHIKRVVLVVRTYPIRVAGNSGPARGKEIEWEDIKKSSGAGYNIEERTTVTKNIRRVFEFSIAEVKDAVRLNSATNIALMFADYIDYNNYGATDESELSSDVMRFIEMVEMETNVPISLVGTGPLHSHMIDRGNWD